MSIIPHHNAPGGPSPVVDHGWGRNTTVSRSNGPRRETPNEVTAPLPPVVDASAHRPHPTTNAPANAGTNAFDPDTERVTNAPASVRADARTDASVDAFANTSPDARTVRTVAATARTAPVNAPANAGTGTPDASGRTPANASGSFGPLPGPLSEVPPETAAEMTMVLPTIKPRPPLAVLLGLKPDPRLLARGLVCDKTGLTTWRYEHRAQWERREAAREHAHRLRVKARELAKRVEAMKTVLGPMLGLEPFQVDIDVPLDYDRVPTDAVPDEDADQYDPADVATSNAVRPVIRIALPDHFHGEAQKMQVINLIQERLGGSWSGKWLMTQYPHVAELRKKVERPRPPKAVKPQWSDNPYSIIVGESGYGLVTVETETETPHWAVSAGSGGGKTSTLTIPAVHWRRHGALIDMIDMKEDSFGNPNTEEFFEGVPGFRIHRTPSAAAMCIAEFFTSSKSLSTAAANGYDMSTIPHRVLIIDEFGSFMDNIDIWWKMGLGEKGTPPVFSWLHQAAMQGRVKNHRLILGTHDFSLETFKKRGFRDLIGTKIKIGPISQPEWVTTYGHGYPRIVVPKKPGRGVIGITGTDPREVQFIFVSKDDARAMALECPEVPDWYTRGELAPWITEESIAVASEAGAVEQFLPGGDYVPLASLAPSRPAVPASQPGNVSPGLPGKPGKLTLVATPEERENRRRASRMTMREALEKGHVSQLIREQEHRRPDDDHDRHIDLALQVMRTASKKDDSGFPAPISRRGPAHLYEVGALEDWAVNRPAAIDFTAPDNKVSGE
jgi:hypothetical protein